EGKGERSKTGRPDGQTASESGRSDDDLGPPLPAGEGTGERLTDLGRRFGVSPSEIAADIRTLTLLGDHADAEWLLSLSVWQQDDRVSISSAGPFRRPLRFTPEEIAALKVALAMDDEGAPILEKLNALTSASTRSGITAASPERSPEVHELIANAALNQH